MMNIEQVSKILRDGATRRGYMIEERRSGSTSSRYFKLFAGDTSLMFRVADHQAKPDANVITLRLDKKNTPQNIERFIANRCADLSYRRTRELLGMRAPSSRSHF